MSRAGAAAPTAPGAAVPRARAARALRGALPGPPTAPAPPVHGPSVSPPRRHPAVARARAGDDERLPREGHADHACASAAAAGAGHHSLHSTSANGPPALLARWGIPPTG